MILISGHNGTALHQPFLTKHLRRRCCVKNCYTSADTLLHAFPSGNERTVWLDKLGIKDTKKSYYICNRHFRPGFIINKKLSRYAYPEFYLGHVDPLEGCADDMNCVKSIKPAPDAYSTSHLCNDEPQQESNNDLVSCATVDPLEESADDMLNCVKTIKPAPDANLSSHLCHDEPLQESYDDLVSCAAGTTVDDQQIQINCYKCKVREARCSEIEAEIKSTQLKIKNLEEKLNLHQQEKKTKENLEYGEEKEEEEEDEYVWLIIN